MDPREYPAAGIEELRVRSTVDGSSEPSLFWKSPEEGERPMLVGLHTWSADRHNQVNNMLPIAQRNNWHLLLPEFRGPNLTRNPRAPEACASRKAMQDVVDAVEYVKAHSAVDGESIFLLGGSGGGHMSLMMAGYRPDIWRSVAAFVSITDLEVWHGENPGYSAHVEACCGGAPSDRTRAEYRARSPMTYLDSIAKAELVIYHGKYDKSVPFTQSLRLYQELCRIAPASRVFLEIFDGAHQILFDVAERQFLNCLGKDRPLATQATA